jgi:hypothetical protein
MFFVVKGPLVILVCTLAVPFVYRFLWPGGVARSSRFFIVSLTVALIVAAAAIFWFSQVLIGIGIAKPSPATAAASTRVVHLLRMRLAVALTFSILAQYGVCYVTQALLGKQVGAVGSNNRWRGP